MHVAEHRQGDVAMQMRIIWGKILPGQWDAFEAACKKALEIRGEVQGLKGQWLLRDQNDPDAGYSISQWESEADMQAFWDSPKRREAMAVLQPFFVNQFTVTHCTVRVASSY
jgi:heme-degrading monooxygenase HmoA